MSRNISHVVMQCKIGILSKRYLAGHLLQQLNSMTAWSLHLQSMQRLYCYRITASSLLFPVVMTMGLMLSCRACDLRIDFVAVGNKSDSSNNRLDYIIAGDSLRRLVPPKTIPESFPLCHPDLSFNNIYTSTMSTISHVLSTGNYFHNPRSYAIDSTWTTAISWRIKPGAYWCVQRRIQRCYFFKDWVG